MKRATLNISFKILDSIRRGFSEEKLSFDYIRAIVLKCASKRPRL